MLSSVLSHRVSLNVKKKKKRKNLKRRKTTHYPHILYSDPSCLACPDNICCVANTTAETSKVGVIITPFGNRNHLGLIVKALRDMDLPI